MGLLDAFGVGGGKLTVQLQNASVAAGGMLTGSATFASGKRSQKITAIAVRLVCNEQHVNKPQYENVSGGKGEAQPTGPQTTTTSRDVVPQQSVTGPFASQPGQTHPFNFQLNIPPNVFPTEPPHRTYRLVASADIDGEIDPGANADVVIVAGGFAGASPSAGSAPGMPAGFGPASAGAQFAPGQPAGGFAPGAPAMPNAPPAIGANVMAQHTNGNWHAARVVSFQNGYVGVDWDDPNLGASSWVQPSQVMASPSRPAGPPTLAVGSLVVAQWQDGNWHPGRVTAMQNGFVGVDWDDPRLGASSWLQPTQVNPR
jgi:hypothetical protein